VSPDRRGFGAMTMSDGCRDLVQKPVPASVLRASGAITILAWALVLTPVNNRSLFLRSPCELQLYARPTGCPLRSHAWFRITAPLVDGYIT
jgi:hypothetical protein